MVCCWWSVSFISTVVVCFSQQSTKISGLESSAIITKFARRIFSFRCFQFGRWLFTYRLELTKISIICMNHPDVQEVRVVVLLTQYYLLLCLFTMCTNTAQCTLETKFTRDHFKDGFLVKFASNDSQSWNLDGK